MSLHLTDTDIVALLARELEPRRAAALEVHIEACPLCAGRLAEEARLEVQLREAGDHLEVPRPSWWRPALLAAVVLFAVGASIGLVMDRSSEPPTPDPGLGLHAGLGGPPAQSPDAWNCLTDCRTPLDDPDRLGER